jgi:hypothetical protein
LDCPPSQCSSNVPVFWIVQSIYVASSIVSLLWMVQLRQSHPFSPSFSNYPQTHAIVPLSLNLNLLGILFHFLKFPPLSVWFLWIVQLPQIHPFSHFPEINPLSQPPPLDCPIFPNSLI